MFLNQSLRFSCLLLLAGWFLISSLNAIDARTEKPPKGKLGMSLDYQLAKEDEDARRAIYVWSTHLVFNGNVQSIRDGQLITLLWDARDEFVEDAQQYEFGPKRWPGAITILAFDNEIIISSSQKGPSFTYKYSQTPVKELLAQCSAIWQQGAAGREEKQHRSQGSCGEIMTAHQYYLTRQNQQGPPLHTQNARTVTLFHNPFTKITDLIPPCGTNQAVSNLSLSTTQQVPE